MKNQKFNIDFIKNKKIYFAISLGIIAIGLIFNIIFGTQLSIKFTGGAIVKYSYQGDIDQNSLESVIQTATTKDTVSIQISSDIISNSDGQHNNNVSVQFPGNQAIDTETQTALNQALKDNFPDNNFALTESNSVDPTNGKTFFMKCLFAVFLAAVLMVIYVAFRFRKIGGWSAGVMAVVALLHDVAIIYFTFVILRMPIDDNFIAVSLMILGYSLNDTVVIYDRIRENRKLMGTKYTTTEIVNKSLNQTFVRTINTSITTAAAIGTVLVVALLFNLSSVVSFALPMLVGVVVGCYSSVCVASPLWVMWQNKKESNLKAQQEAQQAQKAAKKAKNKKKKNSK
ncbi:MAG: protein translocase subunit SecF [Clostridia bacterium]|nr:protein translocase subunit SecF [Clostridia bacterium]